MTRERRARHGVCLRLRANRTTFIAMNVPGAGAPEWKDDMARVVEACVH